MPIIGRMVIITYNLLMLAIAGLLSAISLGWTEPLTYLNVAVSTPGNKIIMGAIGIIIAIIALSMLVWSLRGQAREQSVLVEKGSVGEVSISIAATKVIIMKALKQVEGVKDIKPTVGQSPTGLMVRLHIMINPDYSVPETAQCLQAAVKDNLEKIGGLQVAEIKVLVDEFNPVSK
jgi:uncharacterized alkaline shock family protein YloU